MLILALASEQGPTATTKTVRTRSESSSLSPPPPDLQSRLSTPSSDELQPPRLSLTHDPLAPTRTLARTPPAQREDDTVQSIEGARRAPLGRLSDRLSFGVEPGSDVEDTMMNILSQRPDATGLQDDTFDFDVPPAQFGELAFPHFAELKYSDDTLDLRGAGDAGMEGEYTGALGRSSPTLMDLEVPVEKPAKPIKPQKYGLLICSLTFRFSRHGVVVPSLPTDLIRNLAQQFASKPISKDVLPVLQRATDEFFRNVRLIIVLSLGLS